MRNCIMADIRRVQKKRSFLICLAIEAALLVLAGLLAYAVPLPISMTGSEKGGTAPSMEIYIMIAFFFYPLFVGIPIFSAIYSDDFKSRSMQTAIGFGITRRKLIWARFFEVLILALETAVLFTAIVYAVDLWTGISFGDATDMILKQVWIKDFEIIGFLSISLIIVYGTQKPGSGMVLYILLLMGVFSALITLADMIPFFSRNHIKISEYVPSGVVSTMQKAIFGDDPGKAVIAGLCFTVFYILLPVILSIRIFEKKELDF
ncbi:MAG: hypothetical protein K6B72_08155 [Lachnospiraceae bacterium]|nr:hypothetical protein [Lachnospiraceae bacterium]